ncbi:MAG: DUF4302 domain-containing protein [Muribaculaceae bacterium]|nr:DUF4302 domain-containing protein [Muribaculaceae bacterium]
MKKSIYLAAFATLALTACDSDSDRIFDQSAADRLEQYKKDYADVLTADGGLWTMEYFSNEEEPGYLFVMKFDEDGSVMIGANHKWIGGTYKEETSLWKMIADNGPVLTFNSYNSLFHIFSDPANITGSDAPTGDQGEDINETGYGHNGDYEFQVMEVSEDGKTMRLLGKKRLYDIYLRRLDATTDMKEYMDDYKHLESSLFSKEINNLRFTDADGETYMVNGCYSGIMSIYPETGDAVDQTHSANFIITNSGIRFMEPLEYVNSAGVEKEISEFRFVGNRSLALIDADNAILNAGNFEDIMMRNVRNWKVDLKNLEGSFKTHIDSFVEELKTLYKYKSANLQEMSFEYDATKELYVLRLYIRISAKGNETNRFIVTFSETDGRVKIKIGEPYDNSSLLAFNAYQELQKFFSMIESSEFTYSSLSDCGPKNLQVSNGEGAFKMTAI